MDVVRDDSAYPEIIWTFFENDPKISESLASRLGPGIDRGRVTLHHGIDCNELFPALYGHWNRLEQAPLPKQIVPSNPVVISPKLLQLVEAQVDFKGVIEGNDEDRPPLVDICVGRDRELNTIRQSESTVVFINGLGGQGKSTLASRFFEESRPLAKYTYLVWRDCKEESARFENQIASVVERLSQGVISSQDLAKQSASAIVDILAEYIKTISILFVFDNVDNYVDLDTGTFIGAPDLLVKRLLSLSTSSRVLFTCRPSIAYPGPRTLTCRLEGLDLPATLSLFEQRNARVTPEEIQEAHEVTEGHAFWLDLLAIQVAKPNAAADLPQLISEIRLGRGSLPLKALNSIWGTLHEREQTVLRAMAESVKPVTDSELVDYLSDRLNYNKIYKALRRLKALNLVVIKQHPTAEDVLELHPLVRHFVKKKFTPVERYSFINGIIKTYKRMIGKYKDQLVSRPTVSTLLYWTQNAELDVAAGKFSDAFATLAEVSTIFQGSAYSREFARVARLLLESSPWIEEHRRYKHFDEVFDAQSDILSYLGETNEVDDLLRSYKLTVPLKDARYIRYCSMRCHSHWIRREYSEALKWGREGVELRKMSDADLCFDIDHMLALAERDAGRPEHALETMLGGRRLETVLDPKDLDEERSGVHYGNIGRCLQFMGQIEEALICYQKSAILIEKDQSSEHFLNQGYVRLWFGEVLVARGQLKLGYAFCRAAYLKWEHVAPQMAASALRFARQLLHASPEWEEISNKGIESICKDWIVGINVDSLVDIDARITS